MESVGAAASTPSNRIERSSRSGLVRYIAAIAAVAVGSAAFAITFRALLAAVYRALFNATNVVTAIEQLPWWLRLGVPCAGGLLAGLVPRVRSESRQNISSVMEAVVLGNVRLSLRTTMHRVTASWIAIASGLSIGREGPLIEFGGSLGAVTGRSIQLTPRQTRVLVAAGTAAGFAAAYNTPFAAILFVLETIVGIAALEAVLPIAAATAIASMLTRSIVGGGPIYGARNFTTTSAWEFPAFLAVAVVAAVAASIFTRTLSLCEQLFARASLRQPLRAAVGGLLVGAVACVVPQIAGNGYEPLNELLDGRLALSLLPILFLAKIAASSTSVASGVPGGIFTPVLLIGGITGAAWGHATGLFWNDPASHVGSYALLGMAATTAASIHAPLTAAVLVFELSGDYAIVVPLLLVTTVATMTSRLVGGRSVYEAELRRRGLRWRLTLEGREVAGDPYPVPTGLPAPPP